jgi:hypothetical protein
MVSIMLLKSKTYRTPQCAIFPTSSHFSFLALHNTVPDEQTCPTSIASVSTYRGSCTFPSEKVYSCGIWYTCSYIFVCGEGPRSRCYVRTAALRLIVQPCNKNFFFSFFRVMEHRWKEIDRGKPKYSGKKTCHSATLSTNKSHMD